MQGYNRVLVLSGPIKFPLFDTHYLRIVFSLHSFPIISEATLLWNKFLCQLSCSMHVQVSPCFLFFTYHTLLFDDQEDVLYNSTPAIPMAWLFIITRNTNCLIGSHALKQCNGDVVSLACDFLAL